MKMKKLFALITVVTVIFVFQPASAKKKILIYTKNGKGYVHKNIPASVRAIQEICAQENILTDVSDDPSVFTAENLRKYDALFFANSNNEGFDTEEQKKAFQDYCRSGKGFAALHSASATERQWPWYRALVGGKFYTHPPHQQFDVVVVDKKHPSTKHLPERWSVTDECYYSFHLNPDIHILLAADMNTVEDDKKAQYPGEVFGDRFPLCWCHRFEGGRQWYSALGHDSEFYSDELFRDHLRGGILWILGIRD
jgi:type 1 glutamine amidotransferase